MRRLLVTCLIACLVGPLAAQTTPRTNTQTGKTITAPKTSFAPSGASQRSGAAKSQKNTRAAQNSDTKQTVAPNAEADNSASRTSQPPAQNRSSQTQTTGNSTRNNTARPSSAANQNNGTTPRTITNAVKKAPDVKAAAVNPVKVKWMTLEEALEKSKTDKRKIFVDVMTDWCSWCKRMDSTTFISPAVVQYLNDNYYPVKFNAEQQKEIVFKDKTYQFKKNGGRGYHELAAEWLNNRLSYPTVVFLDETQATIQPLPGYQDAAKMEAVLNYFGTDSHKKTPWETYLKNFNQRQKD